VYIIECGRDYVERLKPIFEVGFAASSRAFAVVIFILCGCCIIINIDHLMRTTFTVLLFLLVLQGYVVYLGDADPALHPDSVKANHHNILSSAVGRSSIQVPDL
jgi:hypothetical protein